MQRRDFLRLSVTGPLGAVLAAADTRALGQGATRKILIAGGNYGTPFIRYMAALTGKKRPRLLYLPTASADSPTGIISWFRSCAPLDVYPLAQESFIASSRQTQSWEEVLLSVDGIVGSGGNTLNQQAIWKAQGIDVDPAQGVGPRHRPRRRERGLAVLVRGGHDRLAAEGAHDGPVPRVPEGQPLPHYDAEADRRPLYRKLIGSGEMKPGYACDNDAGIYFEDNEVKRVVTSRAGAKVYYVSRVGGEAVERPLEPEFID